MGRGTSCRPTGAGRGYSGRTGGGHHRHLESLCGRAASTRTLEPAGRLWLSTVDRADRHPAAHGNQSWRLVSTRVLDRGGRTHANGDGVGADSRACRGNGSPVKGWCAGDFGARRDAVAGGIGAGSRRTGRGRGGGPRVRGTGRAGTGHPRQSGLIGRHVERVGGARLTHDLVRAGVLGGAAYRGRGRRGGIVARAQGSRIAGHSRCSRDYSGPAGDRTRVDTDHLAHHRGAGARYPARRPEMGGVGDARVRSGGCRRRHRGARALFAVPCSRTCLCGIDIHPPRLGMGRRRPDDGGEISVWMERCRGPHQCRSTSGGGATAGDHAPVPVGAVVDSSAGSISSLDSRRHGEQRRLACRRARCARRRYSRAPGRGTAACRSRAAGTSGARRRLGCRAGRHPWPTSGFVENSGTTRHGLPRRRYRAVPGARPVEPHRGTPDRRAAVIAAHLVWIALLAAGGVAVLRRQHARQVGSGGTQDPKICTPDSDN
ncbi:putative transmembrane protein [Mycobacteroides abscessus MAB_030201_1061]|nr:putative transmembrane protein [Mycobacteroides abscessus MAB_030201_1061]